MVENIVESPIFICTGEPSGDLYAGIFIEKLKRENPDLKIYGVGGEEMQRSGVEVVVNFNSLGTFGFSGGISSSLRNYRIYKKIAKTLYQIQPKTFIAVAYPGINLLLCKFVKKLGCKIFYFLPPQIWTWGSFRKYFIKKWVDKVISIFPFEYEYYKKVGIDAIYLENPLFEMLKKYKRNDFSKRIGFMPGSRPGQIKSNFPIMILLMEKINKEYRDLEFDLILYSKHLVNNEWLLTVFKSLKSSLKHKIKIILKNRYQVMKNCDVLIISSGTASLEAAIMKKPQLFFNYPSFFDYYLFRRFLKINEYNLVNLYFNEKIVPSFISHNKNYIIQNLYTLIISYLSD